MVGVVVVAGGMPGGVVERLTAAGLQLPNGFVSPHAQRRRAGREEPGGLWWRLGGFVGFALNRWQRRPPHGSFEQFHK